MQAELSWLTDPTVFRVNPLDGHGSLRPPEIDWEDCHAGSYVREFDLDEDLRRKRGRVSFQGAEQALYVWLNGQFVGYAENNFTPSEFDLTPYLKETGNRLCAGVYKYSSAAWIEDQDFFRFSGVFRSVYLDARPEAHLEDLWLQATLEEREVRVSIRFAYTSHALPGLRTEVTYTLESSGAVGVTVHYYGGPNRPELPLLGLRFQTPGPLEKVHWLELSGETYPDRKKGGVFGWHEEAPYHVSGEQDRSFPFHIHL